MKYPGERQKTNKIVVQIYTLNGKDSIACSAATIDLKVIANLDSATLAPMKDRQEFADQMKMGMASS